MGHGRGVAEHDGNAATPCACVACGRARETQALVNRLREAGKVDFVASAASADAAKMAELRAAVARILGGELVKATPKAKATGAVTFEALSRDWTTGKLHERFPTRSTASARPHKI